MASGYRPAKEQARRGPCIMTGSHIDSQSNGGRFAGSYAVFADC
jgi:hypothetical protein